MSILDLFLGGSATSKSSTPSPSFYDHFDWDDEFYVTAVNEDGCVFAGFMPRQAWRAERPVLELEAV